MERPEEWSALPEATLGPESVSIVIPTYNRADLVVEAVEGALAQTHAPVEVIVVDDGSTDDTARVLEPFRDRIRYVAQENRGLAGARNRGILESKGEYLAFLDSDDACLPGWIGKAIDTFRRHPEAGAVASAEFEIDETGNRGRIHTKRTPGIWFTPEGLISQDTGVGSGRPPVVRREWVRRLGGFDESIRCAVDCAMWIPFSFHARMVLQPEPVLLRRFHSGNISGNIKVDAWDWVRLLERLRREQPEFCERNSRLVRRAMAKSWTRFGREVLASSGGDPTQIEEARAALRCALAELPTFGRAWRYLFLSWLAPRRYGRMRRWEQDQKSAVFKRRLSRGPKRRGDRR
jgi:glycosyltransferase involved in cell wall biosynthesis